jgi:hypothetical protein
VEEIINEYMAEAKRPHKYINKDSTKHKLEIE